MDRELKLGAEARLTLKGNVVTKKRIKKSYRLEQIDINLRKARTSQEASLLQKAARARINVPKVLKVDKENFSIEMDFVNGTLIDKIINEKYAKELGREIAVMHDNSIIHGDLTTSNIIVKNNEVYFIDFGLGEISDSIEKKAVDLRVLKESIRANHPQKADKLNKIILDSYKKHSKKAAEVLKRLEDVEKRGRYKERGAQ